MFRGPALGLFSSPNPFSQTPDGTLRTADNVRFTAPGVIEPRRGFDYLTGSTFGSTGSLARSMAFYAGNILLAYDLTKVSLYTTSFADFTGSFTPVGDNRMRFEGAARSCFFNTTQGLQVWDGVGVSGQPVLAGNQQGLYATAHNTTNNGWQLPDTAVAYRFTICSKDAFGRVIEGPPSGRVTLVNKIASAVGGMTRAANVVTVTTGLAVNWLTVGAVVNLTPGEATFPAGSKTVTSVGIALTTFTYAEAAANSVSTLAQTFEITRSASLTLHFPKAPAGVACTTNNFLRVYRSLMTDSATATPSDELYQCYESPYLTATDVTNGYLTFNDVAPEDTINVPLYTNANTGAGELQANYQPPTALDIAYWASRMWFANTADRHSMLVTLLGVGSPDGVQNGDTIEVAGTVYTAGTDFTVTSYGDPGFNVEQTAQSLVVAVNLNAQQDIFARYVSSEGGTPGEMLFEARLFGDGHSFAAYSSRATAWSPQLPTLISPPFPAPTSDANVHPAGLFYSRLGQPEAVPLVNFALVNSDNDAILRIFPLHYRLLIFKTDGIYTCTNVEPFSIQKLSAYVLIAPDSVQVLEDRVYALTDQGIVTVSDAGVVEISDCIDDVFNALDAPTVITTTSRRAFGLSYRSERQALLWVPERNDDGTFSTDDEQAFVYSTMAEGFTRYDFGVRCGAINPTTNSMVVAPIDDNRLWLENKSRTDADYFDLSRSLGMPASVAGAVLTFASDIDAAAGDVVGHSGAYYRVVEVDGVTVTTDGATGWTSGTTVTLYPAIATRVEFNKFTAGTPADQKIVTQASLLFRQNNVHDVTADFASEISTAEPVELSLVGWGEFKWGSQPYGSPTQQLQRIEPLPTEVAQCAQLSAAFETRQAMAKFEFLGIDVASKKDTSVNRG